MSQPHNQEFNTVRRTARFMLRTTPEGQGRNPSQAAQKTGLEAISQNAAQNRHSGNSKTWQKTRDRFSKVFVSPLPRWDSVPEEPAHASRPPAKVKGTEPLTLAGTFKRVSGTGKGEKAPTGTSKLDFEPGLPYYQRMAVNGKHPEQEETITFSPEQMELIRQGEESLATERRYTQQEVRENARKRTRAWLSESQPHSA
jgi:hypothetical protein